MRSLAASARIVCALAALSFPCLAAADEPDASAVGPSLERWIPEPEGALEGRRGGQVGVVSVNAAELDTEVTGNQVGDGVITGPIALSTSALSQIDGLFVGTFNTGNNVSIQTNLNVAIQLQ